MIGTAGSKVLRHSVRLLSPLVREESGVRFGDGGIVLFAGCGVVRREPGRVDVTFGKHDRAIAEKGPVKLFVRVSPREPRLSDLVEMDVRVESPTRH